MPWPPCSLARRKPEDALAWVERGIAIDEKTPHGSMAGHDLAKLKRVSCSRSSAGAARHSKPPGLRIASTRAGTPTTTS